MSRWERREDYKKDYQKDENGRYRYVGQWYALENHAERGKKLKWGYRLQQLLTLALMIFPSAGSIAVTFSDVNAASAVPPTSYTTA